MFKVLGMGDDHSASTHKAVGRGHARGETPGVRMYLSVCTYWPCELEGTGSANVDIAF